MSGLFISFHSVEVGAVQRASKLNSLWLRRSQSVTQATPLPPPRVGPRLRKPSADNQPASPATLPPPRDRSPSADKLIFIRSKITHFWSQVDKTHTECWIWTGPKAAHGYGQYSVNQVHIMGHRYAYIVTRGPVPEGYQVTHKCGNILCMKPDHLLAVTPKERGQLQRAKRAALRAKQILGPAAIGALVTLLRTE
jgi:HNH endonuclease